MCPFTCISHILLWYTTVSMYMYLVPTCFVDVVCMEKGVCRASQANSGQLFWLVGPHQCCTCVAALRRPRLIYKSIVLSESAGP